MIQVNFYSGFLDSTFLIKYDSFLKIHRTEYDSIAALKKSGMMAGDYFSKKYKDEFEKYAPAFFFLLLDHIDYIVKLVGIDYVGLGSDFDGIDSAASRAGRCGRLS